MYIKWQPRKRNSPDIGSWKGEVKDADGNCVRDGRWNLLRTRRRADGTLGQDVRWTAVLVESIRVNGKPVQRHIATIASITESRMEVVHQRRYFWNDVYDRLDRLDNRMTLEQRRAIEAAIAVKVPRLSREEHEASIADVSAQFGAEWASPKPWRESSP